MNECSNFAHLREADSLHHIHPLTIPKTLLELGPDLVTRAEGIYLYLQNGRKVIDGTSALWNVNLGYGNRRLCSVAHSVMCELSFAQTIFGRSNPWVAALSEKLAQISPAQFRRFHFASTGSEANEISIKLAWLYWRALGKPTKRKIIARRGAFHGNTIFAASVTGTDLYHAQFGLPLDNAVHHTESTNWYVEGRGRSEEQFFVDITNALENQILEIGPDNIAAFMAEPIQCGMIAPHRYYWPRVRQICDKYDILVVSDEVVSGFGKSGRLFGFENFEFEPDMFTMAKSITSGYFPLSAVAIGSKVGDVVHGLGEMFGHVFTNSGHPVGAAVALEAIAILEDQQLVSRVRDEIGPHFKERLETLLELPCVAMVRSIGVMGAIELDASGGAGSATVEDNAVLQGQIGQAAWENGVAIRGGALCLPMVITRPEIDELFDKLSESILQVWQQRG